MKITRWDPFRDTETIFDRYARALDSPLAKEMALMHHGGEWSPRVDISETEDHFTVAVEIPGINREDVKISVEEDVLTIRGERKEEKEEKRRKYHRTERYHGVFSRSFSLPQNVDEKQIDASFNDGLLTLNIKKKAADKPKSFEVKIH